MVFKINYLDTQAQEHRGVCHVETFDSNQSSRGVLCALPALVLLPGLDGTGKLFAEFLKVLDPEFNVTVIAYPKDVPASYAELEALVRSALPPDRPFVLLGESFSGPIAIRIAASPPKGLVGLILCVTFARNPFPYLAWARPLAVYLPLKHLPRWARAPLMWGSTRPNRAPRQSERAMASVSPVVIRHRIAALLAADETATLPKVAVPTLVLRATQDRVVSRAATECIMRGILHAQRVDIDGPHLLLQTRAEECAAAVQSFAAQIKEEPDRLMATR
jgi:pimeloyl-[acyl-carrier protein] methyl ester esterase